MPANQGFFRQTWRIAWKDLQVEVRSREILYTMAFFAGLIVVIFAVAFPENSTLARLSTPGILWVAMVFAGTIGLGRAFDRERENDTLRALILTPVSRLAILLGKATAIAVLTLVVGAVCACLVALMFNVPMFELPVALVLTLVLGAIGFAVVGTVFAAVLLKVRSRDVLLPVILYPILIPLIVKGATAIEAMLKAPVPDPDKAWDQIRFMGIYDGAFLVLSFWIFESLVIE